MLWYSNASEAILMWVNRSNGLTNNYEYRWVGANAMELRLSSTNPLILPQQNKAQKYHVYMLWDTFSGNRVFPETSKPNVKTAFADILY